MTTQPYGMVYTSPNVDITWPHRCDTDVRSSGDWELGSPLVNCIAIVSMLSVTEYKYVFMIINTPEFLNVYVVMARILKYHLDLISQYPNV